MLETSRGDLVVDLFTEDCPITTKNFLKLCKYVHRLAKTTAGALLVLGTQRDVFMQDQVLQ